MKEHMIIEKTGKMMNEEQYWGFVDNSLKMTQDQYQQGQFLASEIKKLSPHEMIETAFLWRLIPGLSGNLDLFA